MKVSSILLSSILAITAIAGPTSIHVVHEKRDVSNPRWEKRQAMDADTKIPVRIALKQQNVSDGEKYLMRMYVEQFLKTLELMAAAYCVTWS